MDFARGSITQANKYLRRYEPLEIVLQTLFAIVSVFLTIRAFNALSGGFQVKTFVFKFVTSLPYLREIKKKKLQEAKKDIFKTVHGKLCKLGYRTCLPSMSSSVSEVLKVASSYHSSSAVSWKDGRMSGAVYPSNSGLNELLIEIQKMTLWSNPLHVDAFPAVRRMEAEVVRMCLTMFNGDSESCGTMTSGGTESIMLACLAYRNRAYKLGIKEPEVVIPISAHAAFDKAGSMMNIRVKKVPLDPKTFKVDLRAMKRAITRRTCMLVGSAPQYPQGIIDDIKSIAKLGALRGIPVHVDCCLGGFLVPFMEEAGFPLDLFDFRLPGVTSISCDTHKYGFAAKGSSVIMYRNRALRANQFFLLPDWSGGIYASPTFAGSRSGALIAACWSALMYFGREGYVNSTKRIISTARTIAKGVSSIPGLRVLGEPQVSVVAFTSDAFDIYQLAELMSHHPDGSANWSLSVLQYPPAVHLCVTDLHTQPGVAQLFLDDLKVAAERLLNSPKSESTGTAAIYGMCAQIPDRSLVASVVASFLDACYATEGPDD
ncbi:Sphingosine-1-phosphate lyase 1 [Echinococcus granulosus]|uniref:sphinganine-1-phosphate aldolase n=1 Tax=Echinococcus granulosus TaxID=6210 RepID=A0A068WJB7_ECHGR|nr:Sphingosine-1-phosphate lyase 1 [Echinococcus granulosus]CDS18557.1 sphingosine 1 phosphate lyase 1 [Echinococcus granulosus]